LRNSNISREPGRKKQRLFLLAMAVLVMVCFAIRGQAVDPLRMTSQYMWERWGSERGFPGGSVSAIAQTADGYLWIGTSKGLIRFDGISFRVFPQAIPGSSPIDSVQNLLTDADGNLWVLLQSTRILRYHDGKFEPGHDQAEFGITAIDKQKNGAVLFSSLAFGPLRFRQGKFETLLAQAEPTSGQAYDELSSRFSWSTGVAEHRLAEPDSAVISATETMDGKVWLGTREKGLYSLVGGRITPVQNAKPNARITCMLPLQDGKLWIGTENGVFEWNGTSLSQSDVPASLRLTKIFTMIRDSDSNMWVGTAQGLLRFNTKGVSEETSEVNSPATALFEDREGNIWAGDQRGIERLRDSTFITYAVADAHSESSGPIYVDDGGRAWFAPFEGGLHWLKDGRSESVPNDGLNQDVIYSISGAKNELWIGRQRGGLTHLEFSNGSITTKTYTQKDGLPQDGVYAVYRSNDGSVWAATLNGGVSKYNKGQFTTYSTANGMASDTVSSIAQSQDGTMWFGTPNGLNSFSNDQWRVLTVRDGMPSNDVNCLLMDSGGVLWIGTPSGLAFLNSGHVRHPGGGPESLHEPIMGIAEDRTGRLWISTSNHILAAKRNKLVESEFNQAEVREYGLEDGLQGMEGVKRQPSVFTDTFGRVWVSTNRGLSVVDTGRVVDSSVPAIVQIEGLFSDGNAIELQPPVRVPHGGQRVTFNYSGLSLSVPERVRFKYMLEGFDRDWSEPTAARQAVYTNLGPGSYRFRVMASNSNGLWNTSDAALQFRVDPAYWQTWWFQLSSVLLIGIAALTLFRLRELSLTNRMNMLFEERLGERTRIAQDLHDTLLQGVLSASMQLHVADEHLPPNSPAKPLVGRVLELMGYVIAEGRNAVTGLRSTQSNSIRLEQAFSRVQEELCPQNKTDFRVIVEGADRPVHPIIKDEIYGIGREALANAFRHSRASSIELELEYAADELRVLVRDNGIGIDPQVLRTGRDGHWGMLGMRERAKRIGAKLRVLSRATAGTEVELRVPSRVAFVSGPSTHTLSWLGALFSRKKNQPENRNGNEVDV
jgi:ligand-binding sensor domain-containing protein/signal transduction histidine kinase